MNFENIVIFPPNDNRFLNFVPNVINLPGGPKITEQ